MQEETSRNVEKSAGWLQPKDIFNQFRRRWDPGGLPHPALHEGKGFFRGFQSGQEAEIGGRQAKRSRHWRAQEQLARAGVQAMLKKAV